MNEKLGSVSSLKAALMRDLAVKMAATRRLTSQGLMDPLTSSAIQDQTNKLAKIATLVDSSKSPAYSYFLDQETDLISILDNFKYAEH